MAVYDLDDKKGFFASLTIKNPSRILRKDDDVKFNHFNYYVPLKAVIVNATDNTAVIKLKEKTTDSDLNIGDPVIFIHGTVYDAIIFSGAIESIKNEINEITIKIENIEKMRESQKSGKYYVSMKASLKVVGIPENIGSVIKYLSLGGVKINCTEDLMMEDIIDVTILNEKMNKISFKGRVVRKNEISNTFEYGIQIDEIPETSSKNLHLLISSFLN